MKTIISFFAAFILASAVGTAWADEASYGTTTCFVEVVPNKSVSPVDDNIHTGTTRVGPFSAHEETCAAKARSLTDDWVYVTPTCPNLDLGSVQTGVFTGQMSFWVDSNCRAVRLCAGASHLYKGGDPINPTVSPILLHFDSGIGGIVVELPEGGPCGGADNFLEYTQPILIDEFPGLATVDLVFESSQAGYFSQEVTLTVTWNQDDPEKPMGEYAGKVRLYCWVASPTAAESETWSRVKAMYR